MGQLLLVRKRRAPRITRMSRAEATSKPGRLALSPKPESGSIFTLGVGVAVPGVCVPEAAWVCARAAWVSSACTVCVAELAKDVNTGVMGVAVGISVGVAVGVAVTVRLGVKVGVAAGTCAVWVAKIAAAIWVAVASSSACDGSQAAATRIKREMIRVC